MEAQLHDLSVFVSIFNELASLQLCNSSFAVRDRRESAVLKNVGHPNIFIIEIHTYQHSITYRLVFSEQFGLNKAVLTLA